MVGTVRRDTNAKVMLTGALLGICALLAAAMPARCSAAEDDAEFRALVGDNLQFVLTSVQKCETLEANANDAVRQALAAISTVPGNYDFVPQQTFEAVQNAAGQT